MRGFVSKYAGCIFGSHMVPNLHSAYLLRSKYADSSPMFDVRAKTTISQLFDNEMTCRFDCTKATYWCTYPRNFVTFYWPETSKSLVKFGKFIAHVNCAIPADLYQKICTPHILTVLNMRTTESLQTPHISSLKICGPHICIKPLYLNTKSPRHLIFEEKKPWKTKQHIPTRL